MLSMRNKSLQLCFFLDWLVWVLMGWGRKLTVPEGLAEWEDSSGGSPHPLGLLQMWHLGTESLSVLPQQDSSSSVCCGSWVALHVGLYWKIKTCVQRESSRNAPGDDDGSLISKWGFPFHWVRSCVINQHLDDCGLVLLFYVWKLPSSRTPTKNSYFVWKLFPQRILGH